MQPCQGNGQSEQFLWYRFGIFSSMVEGARRREDVVAAGVRISTGDVCLEPIISKGSHR